ncbi:MAG: thiol-activated cytolysin family protein [Bacteroidales bacterium]
MLKSMKPEIDTTLEYITKTDYYSVAVGFDDQIVLNPQTDVIYPGALVKGESVLDGSYTLIPAQRKPITISTSLTGSSSVSITIEDPKLSTVREAVNTLMNQEYDVPAANMGYTIEQAYSEQQLDLSLHASYKSAGINVSGSFDFTNKNIKTRLVAKYIQSYYTLDMDLPNQPSDLFEDNIDQALIGTYMPMYVSTVTFGRMAIFTIESELSETEVRTYLEGSFSSVDLDISADFEALKESSTMKVYVLGGSSSSAAATIDGFAKFKEYIIEGGNFSKDSPGAPISYKLRYIRDNSIGKIVFAASYPIRTALPRTDNIVYDINARLMKFKTCVDDGLGSECEIKGDIFSWPKSLGESAKHDHLTYLVDAPQDGEYPFSETVNTSKTWQGLKQNDTLMIRISLIEDDKGDDVFHIDDVAVPVSAILLESIDVGFFEKIMRTIYDSNEYIDVYFNFTPSNMRHEDTKTKLK